MLESGLEGEVSVGDGEERREGKGVTCLGAGNTLVGGRCGRLFGIGLGVSRGSIVRWRGGVDVVQGRLCRRCRLLLYSWGVEVSKGWNVRVFEKHTLCLSSVTGLGPWLVSDGIL